MYPRLTCLLGLLGVQQVLRSEFGTEHLWQLAVVLQTLPGLEEIQPSKGRLSSEALMELEARQGQRQLKSLPCPQPVTWLLSQLLTCGPGRARSPWLVPLLKSSSANPGPSVPLLTPLDVCAL